MEETLFWLCICVGVLLLGLIVCTGWKRQYWAVICLLCVIPIFSFSFDYIEAELNNSTTADIVNVSEVQEPEVQEPEVQEPEGQELGVEETRTKAHIIMGFLLLCIIVCIVCIIYLAHKPHECARSMDYLPWVLWGLVCTISLFNFGFGYIEAELNNSTTADIVNVSEVPKEEPESTSVTTTPTVTETTETLESVSDPLLRESLGVTDVLTGNPINDTSGDPLYRNRSIVAITRSSLQSVILDNADMWYTEGVCIGIADLNRNGLADLLVWSEDSDICTIYEANIDALGTIGEPQLINSGTFTCSSPFEINLYWDKVNEAIIVFGVSEDKAFYFTNSNEGYATSEVSMESFERDFEVASTCNFFVQSKPLTDELGLSSALNIMIDKYNSVE